MARVCRCIYEMPPRSSPLMIPSLIAKDPVGTIGDEICEESHLEGKLSELSARHTTSQTSRSGRMKDCLSCCLFVLSFSGKTDAISSYELRI